MSSIFGLLNISDADLTMVNSVGQRVLYDATTEYLSVINAELNAGLSLFVENTTEDYKERYKLPGGGRLQPRGTLANTAYRRTIGYWDVAYPINDYGAALGMDDVTLAYMTAAEYQRQVDGVVAGNTATVRFDLLKALFNASSRTITDDRWGSLTVQPLANGDSVVYPPAMGSETEATDNHYLESGYAASSIDNTNNPLVTLREELEEHFGTMTGGDNIVVFHNQAQTAKLEALADFDEVPDRYIRPGTGISVPEGAPNTPGIVTGRSSGVWCVEWRWIPANYLLAIHLDQPKPLKMRVDTAASGIPRGLHLYFNDEARPIQTMQWRHRFGFGVGNRLNGVVMELGTGGSYTTPTSYA